MFGCVGRVLAVAVVLASVVPVLGQAQCPDGSPAPCRSAAVAAPAPTSVAVLYFDNASPDSTDDYLAEGLTEAIIAQLGQVGRISVKSRSAVRLTRNPDAYEHFLRGNYGLAQRTSTGLARATAEYRQAVALDSGFVSALARVGLAYALRLDWSWDATGAPPADSLLDRGMAAADEALRRNPSNSDAWLARGYLLEFEHPRTWEGVMAALARAVSLDPRNAEAWHQLGDAAPTLGDDSTAITAWRRAPAVEPRH